MGKVIHSNDRHENEKSLGIQRIQHIPTLPNSRQAFELLQRLFKEFQPLTQSRGYTIVSVTEMCCCGDGEHHIGHQTRKKKFRKMSNSVAGYNLSVGNRGNQIHLRLRSLSPLHELLSYEEVAGVFIHELAHCEIGPHSVEFYKLMEVIEEQFHTNMVNGVVATSNTVNALHGALFTGVGHILGTANTNTTSLRDASTKVLRETAAQAAERRRHLHQITRIGGVVLGGTPTLKLSPREAAASAAERRQRDSQWCLLCSDIIEISDESESDNDQDQKVILPDRQYTRASRSNLGRTNQTTCGSYENGNPKVDATGSIGLKRHKGSQMSKPSGCKSFVDLVELDENTTGKQGEQHSTKNYATAPPELTDITPIQSKIDITDVQRQRTGRDKDKNFVPADSRSFIDLTADNCSTDSVGSSNDFSSQAWACNICTYLNACNNLSCEVCGSPISILSEGKSQELVRVIQREKEIKQLKAIEQNRSKEQFGGFNIYQGGRKNTATMKHLT